MEYEACSICLDPLSIPKPRYELRCKHEYHRECIVEWLKENETCPLCRTRIDPETDYVLDGIMDEMRFEEIFKGLEDWREIFGQTIESLFKMDGYRDSLRKNNMVTDYLQEFGRSIRTEDGQNLAKMGTTILGAITQYQHSTRDWSDTSSSNTSNTSNSSN